MTTLNFIGGGSPDVSVSFTDNWVKSTSGVTLPTNATLAANGNRPVYVNTAQCYWAGRGASRTMNLTIGSKKSANKTVASSSSAQNSGNIAIGYLSANGGTVQVRIDGSGSFWFGRDASVGDAVNIYGTNFGGALSGSVDYFTVPTAPTSVSVAQANLENAVNVSWSAPSSNGGSAVTSYTIQWAYNSSFTGSTTIVTGSSATTHKITGLTYGSNVYVKVAAVNVVATAAGTTSLFSSSANAYLIPPDLPLDGWANETPISGVTYTLQHTWISAVSDTGLVKKAVSTATGGNYGTHARLEKSYSNLELGRVYTVNVKGILLAAGLPVTKYVAFVRDPNGGSAFVGAATTLNTSTKTAFPVMTFTASIPGTYEIGFRSDQSFTVSTIGTQEWVGFVDFDLTRLATDLPYRLQDNMLTANLVEHFDLATESVGATWWVDKTNVTKFAQDFNYVLPSCTFSDVVGEGNIYFNSIGVSFDTAAVVNQIAFSNIGRRAAARGSDQYNAYTVNWLDSDTTSISNWGARKHEMQTNLWTQVNKTNLLGNPHLAYSGEYVGTGSTNAKVTRINIADNATGATGYLATGTTAPVAGAGAYCARSVVTANNANTLIIFGGDGATNSSGDPTVPVVAGSQYSAAVYLRAGVGNTASLTGRVNIYWYTETGALVSTTGGTATTITSTGWTRVTLTTTAPATSAYALVAAWFIYGGANNTNFRYYATCAQLEQASSASTWFSGDTTDDTSYVYEWEGAPGLSNSIRYNNVMDTRTGELLAEFSTPTTRITNLRWNTAQNPVLAASLDIGSIVTITFRGTTDNYRIVGINHEATPDNWHMTLQVTKEN